MQYACIARSTLQHLLRIRPRQQRSIFTKSPHFSLIWPNNLTLSGLEHCFFSFPAASAPWTQLRGLVSSGLVSSGLASTDPQSRRETRNGTRLCQKTELDPVLGGGTGSAEDRTWHGLEIRWNCIRAEKSPSRWDRRFKVKHGNPTLGFRSALRLDSFFFSWGTKSTSAVEQQNGLTSKMDDGKRIQSRRVNGEGFKSGVVIDRRA